MMASYQKFDLESWGRREHFEVFKTYAQNAFSITVEIEITGFLSWVKAKRCKFYPAMIHEVAAVLNRYPEFRMAMKDDELIVYDRLNPSYTIPHVQQESFSSIWSVYHEKKEDFLAEYERDLEKYGQDTRYFPRSDTPENVFYISAVPWVSFTSFSMQFSSLHNLFTPIVTLGKYFERGGKVYIPVAIQLHHAVCDGFHAGRFMTELQKGCHDY